MVTAADLHVALEREYGSRLEPAGFRFMGRDTWVRATKLPIRELVTIHALKGGGYAPGWGLSCGLAPVSKGKAFRHQSTDKNAAMDLNLSFGTDLLAGPRVTFIAGYTTVVPVDAIRRSAEFFLPRAMVDFDRVRTLPDFCTVYHQCEAKFQDFRIWAQHDIVGSFISILQGRQAEGIERLHELCARRGLSFDDPVLAECIRRAEARAASGEA